MFICKVIGTLEKRLWGAADQFCANSGLTAAQYSAPVLGMIFLRFAETRPEKRRAELETARFAYPAGHAGRCRNRRRYQ